MQLEFIELRFADDSRRRDLMGARWGNLEFDCKHVEFDFKHVDFEILTRQLSENTE